MVYIWDLEVREKGHFQKVEIRTKIPKTFHQTKINGTTTLRINFVHTRIYLNTRTFGHQKFFKKQEVKKSGAINSTSRDHQVVFWTEMKVIFITIIIDTLDVCTPFSLSQLRSMMMNWLRLVLYKFYLLFWL